MCDTTIAYLKNPDHDISSTLLAPDFPTGGQILICDPDELREIYRTGRGGVKVRSRYRYDKKENLIEVYEIPYSTSIEAILDKVAELVKAGKVKEINDMRDESDLSGLKLAIDLKRGVDPDKLMAKLLPPDALAGHRQLQFQHPHRRPAPRAGRGRHSGGVDGVAHRVRQAPGVLYPEEEAGQAAPAAGSEAHPAGHRQGHPYHPGDGGGSRGHPQSDDRLRHRSGAGGVRGGDQAAQYQ